MNIYEGICPIYHFDLYRLETEEELEEIGFYEYLEEPEGIVVIEWPDKFPESMPENYVEVAIDRLSETGRKLTFSSIGEENVEFLKELETFVNTGH
jgi:tRNA threonylcarbamoyladenosine biosynthesis protein TsaE